MTFVGGSGSELDRLIAVYRDAKDAINEHLQTLREDCEHEAVVRVYTGGESGYLWRCERCFMEEHSWGPYEFRPKVIRDISRRDFIDGRPSGAHLVMAGD